jgi:hypothetical protein
LTAFGPLKTCGGRHTASHVSTLKKPGRAVTWGSEKMQHGGANIKSIVTNDKAEFKTLIFRTYQKTVKLTVSQLGTVRKFKYWEEV